MTVLADIGFFAVVDQNMTRASANLAPTRSKGVTMAIPSFKPIGRISAPSLSIKDEACVSAFPGKSRIMNIVLA
jgi:hypothetical protein